MPISSGERETFPRAPSTPRRSVATPSSLYPSLLDGVLRAGRRGRIGRSGESSSRRSRGSYRAPTPPWWTRSRDAGLFAEFCCCNFDSSPFPPPNYFITHYQRSRASGAQGTFDAGSRSRVSLAGPAGGRGRLAGRARVFGQIRSNPLKTRTQPISRAQPSSTLLGPRSLQGDVQRINTLLSSALPASSARHGPERSSQRSTLTERSLCQVAETAPANPRTPAPVKNARR